MPAKLEEPKTIHFVKHSPGVGDKIGLGEYCEEMIEAHEPALLDTMRDATPIELPAAFKARDNNKGVLRYELKSAVCVAAAARCTEERLLDISNGRIASAKGSPELRNMIRDFSVSKGVDPEGLKEEM